MKTKKKNSTGKKPNSSGSFKFSYFTLLLEQRNKHEIQKKKGGWNARFFVATQFVYSIKSKNIWYIFNNVAV